jgi:hypothetical protein
LRNPGSRGWGFRFESHRQDFSQIVSNVDFELRSPGCEDDLLHTQGIRGNAPPLQMLLVIATEWSGFGRLICAALLIFAT